MVARRIHNSERSLLMDAASAWWRQIPGPRVFVASVANRILQSESMSLSVGSLPWISEFRTAVRNRVYATSSSAGLDLISGQEFSQQRLQDVLAARLGCLNPIMGPEELRAFLPQQGFTFWLYDLDPSTIRQAETLLTAIRRIGLPICLLIEYAEECQDVQGDLVTYTPSEMDLLYFALTLLMERQLDSTTEYAAHLVALLSDGNPVQLSKLTEQVDSCLTQPVTSCPWLTAQQCTQAVYHAQLRIILPVIETERLYLIGALASPLRKLLPFMDEYLGTYQEPAQLELRHLVYFARHGEIHLTPEEEQRLNLLYEARNQLSHLDILELPILQKILSCRHQADR